MRRVAEFSADRLFKKMRYSVTYIIINKIYLSLSLLCLFVTHFSHHFGEFYVSFGQNELTVSKIN